jgi:hypothetical protein
VKSRAIMGQFEGGFGVRPLRRTVSSRRFDRGLGVLILELLLPSVAGADCVARSYDVEGMHFGTIAAGRIGLAVLRRTKPSDPHLLYTDPHRLNPEIEKSCD